MTTDWSEADYTAATKAYDDFIGDGPACIRAALQAVKYRLQPTPSERIAVALESIAKTLEYELDLANKALHNISLDTEKLVQKVEP